MSRKEKYVLSPYVYETMLNGGTYYGNALSHGQCIKKTDQVRVFFAEHKVLKEIGDSLSKNMLDAFIEKRFFISEREIVLPAPNIELEITNICNANCEMCPRENLERPKGHMSERMFEKFANHVKKYPVPEIEICGVGEPLMHPRVIEIIAQLRRLGSHKLKLVTNGALLSEDMASKIVAAGIDKVSVSFNAIEEKKYERIMAPLSFNTVLSQIEDFQQKYSGSVELMVSSVISDDSEREHILKFWSDRDIKNIVFHKLQSRAGNLMKLDRDIKVKSCPVFNQGLFITWDGKYLSCSNDFRGETHLGCLMDETLQDCLVKKTIKIRNGSLFSLCNYCDYDFHDHMYLPSDFYRHVGYEGIDYGI